MKRLLAIALLIFLLIGGALWYRTSRQVVADIEGNPLRYTYDEIEEEGITGLFVHNYDNTFSPAIRTMPNFSGKTSGTDPTRFLWYVEENKNYSDLIPTVDPGSELVIIYNVDGDLPGSYYLEKYAEKGYTIGAHIFLQRDKTMILSAENYLSGSQAGTALSEMLDNTGNEYTVAEISGSDVLPIKNIDPNMELLLGLEKEKLYKIRYYQGTKERETVFRADAKVFQSERYIPISTPYRKTQDGYFIVNLPENLPRGYYYLSDVGFFKYSK